MEVREAHIRTLFDIDAKKADDLTIREVEQSDEHLSIEMDPLEERLNNIGYIWGSRRAVRGVDRQARACAHHKHCMAQAGRGQRQRVALCPAEKESGAANW